MALRRNIGGITNADILRNAIGVVPSLLSNPTIAASLIKPTMAVTSPANTALNQTLTQFPTEVPISNEMPTATVVQMQTATATVPETSAEPVPVDTGSTPAPAVSKRGLVVGAVATAVAVYALSRKNGSVGSEAPKSERSVLFPLLLVGGAAWYYWYTNVRTDSSTVVSTPNTNGTDTANHNLIPTEQKEPLPGNTPSQPPPFQAAPDVVAAAQQQVGNTNLAALQRDWPALAATIATMTPAEINTMYQYFYGYVVQGMKLYRLPNATGIYADGGWNTQLYDQVAAINAKYKLNTL